MAVRGLYRIVFILTLLLAGQSTYAQETILQKFSAENVSGKVLLSWTVKSGNTCNGIRIYRSGDSLSYTEIGDIQGVCGNLGYSVDYSFQDNTPAKNKINYYRLDLGGVELSYAISVEVIDVGIADYYLQQNPIGDHSKLYFRNLSGEPSYLSIYSNNGVLQEIKETNTDHFELDANDYINGIYYFVLSNSSSTEMIHGKFSVVN